MTPASSDPGRQALVEQAGKTIASGSKSFRFASQIFDIHVRERSWLLYAWCRACDDITDGQTLGHDATVADRPQERIAFIREKTDTALGGSLTGIAAFDALSILARETEIEPELFHDHLAGFESDSAGWSPATEQDMLGYCYKVAGVVGVMMAQVMGVPPGDTDTLDRASDLGIAFQLANIARDIVDDARVGRVYVPSHWLADEGLDPAGLADPACREALARIAARLSRLAEHYRQSSRVGAARLSFRSRWAVLAAGRIYGEVARRTASLGSRAWDKRIVISKGQKLLLVVSALKDALLPPPMVDRSGLWTRPRGRGDARRRGEPARLSTSLRLAPR